MSGAAVAPPEAPAAAPAPAVPGCGVMAMNSFSRSSSTCRCSAARSAATSSNSCFGTVSAPSSPESIALSCFLATHKYKTPMAK